MFYQFFFYRSFMYDDYIFRYLIADSNYAVSFRLKENYKFFGNS